MCYHYTTNPTKKDIMAKDKTEVKSSEPKAISERICSPSPMSSVKEGMAFFLAREGERTMGRYHDTDTNDVKLGLAFIVGKNTSDDRGEVYVDGNAIAIESFNYALKLANDLIDAAIDKLPYLDIAK